MNDSDFFKGLIGLVIVGVILIIGMNLSVNLTFEEINALRDTNQELLIKLEEAKDTIYFQECQADPECMMPELTFEEAHDAEFPPVPATACE